MATFVAASVCGCADRLSPQTRLDDGRRVQALAVGAPATAVLFYRADDCISCVTAIAEWRQLEARGAISIKVVLDREPTDEEVRALKLQRIAIAGVYRRPLFARRAIAPQELLIDSLGRMIASPQDPRSAGVSAALRAAMALSGDGESPAVGGASVVAPSNSP